MTSGLAVAALLGIGFGFCLERAGFGSARRLTAVFYFRDMAVLKVMFTAIVTAMAGVFALSALGVLDLAELYVEPTSLAAQAIGGAIFGAGFLVGGYCPGTCVAAAATGRQDGIAFALGLLAGVLAYAEATPGLEAWIEAISRGEVTLPAVTGLGMGWWVLAFAAVLALLSRALPAVEKRFAG
jgi:hypothetical protein